jgi:tetratricopeptide (TPR) repeat protein
MVCERALAKGVRDGEIFYRQSQAYFGAGRYQEALMSARQALVLKNNYAPARNLEGLVHKKLGQFREAVTDFSAAIKNDPGFFDAYLNRGKVYGILNKNEEALADLRRAFELGPEGGEAAYYLAVVLYQKKELSSARTWLLRAERLGFKGASKEFLEGVGRGGK